MYIYILKWEKFKDRFNYLFKIVSIVALWSYVLFSYQSPYVVISSFYRALESSLNKLWIEDFIFGKKKFFFSKVFTRRICDLFTLLRFHTWNMSSITQRTVETGHWAHCSRTGNDNRRCAQHSGHFVTHFASSAATIPKPSLLSADSVYAIYFFLPSYSPFLSTLS